MRDERALVVGSVVSRADKVHATSTLATPTTTGPSIASGTTTMAEMAAKDGEVAPDASSHGTETVGDAATERQEPEPADALFNYPPSSLPKACTTDPAATIKDNMLHGGAQQGSQGHDLATATAVISTDVAGRSSSQLLVPPPALASHAQAHATRAHSPLWGAPTPETNGVATEEGHETDLQVAAQAAHTSRVVDTFDLAHTVGAPMPPPALSAPVEDHMDFLQQQLDSIGVDRPILDGLLLLGDGGHQRLQGGALLLCASAASCKRYWKYTAFNTLISSIESHRTWISFPQTCARMLW